MDTNHTGTDPEMWAGAFLAAYAQAEGVRSDADRLAFVTTWFRDAMGAAAGTAQWEAQGDCLKLIHNLVRNDDPAERHAVAAAGTQQQPPSQ